MQAFTEYRTLQLESFDGTLIPNGVDDDPPPHLVERTRRGIGPLILANVTQLSTPTGRYNCHGLVFASRRTNIPPPKGEFDIEQLLRWDGYQLTAEPRVGDVAAYRDSRHRIDHTGIVCKIERIGAHPAVFVWSMWGGLGEFLHPAHISPYSKDVEYWRHP